MTVSVNISKALMDIAGERRTEIAVLEILKDAIEHRIEKIPKCHYGTLADCCTL